MAIPAMLSPLRAAGLCGALLGVLGAHPGAAQLASYRAALYAESDLGFYEPAADDEFAFAFAAGDFDGDGADDLATGIPYDDNLVGFYPDSGIVVVRYGMPRRGLAGGLADDVLSQVAGGSPDPQGAAEGDRFGWALASADFDADGFADLAIGALLDGPGRGGAVQVHYGSAAGLDLIGSQHLHQGTPGISGDDEALDWFGTALAAGDFDGDGYPDLAIGVPGENSDFDIGHGRVVTVYGGLDGLSTSRSQSFDQDTAGIPGANEDYDAFGFALAACDFDGDGRDDLAIGVPGENADAGSVRILFGSTTGLVVDGAESWDQGANGVPNAAEAGDRFGWSLACADFEADGYDDLAIGVHREEIFVGVVDSGAVQVLRGSAVGLTASGGELLTQEWPGVPDASESNDQFGIALAVGDFAGDGVADLAIGARGEDLGAGSLEGAVSLVYGYRTLGLNSAFAQQWRQGVAGMPGWGEAGDELGRALAVGDFDGSGHDDLVIGAPRESIDAPGSHHGAEWVLYGCLFAHGFESGSTAGWSTTVP